jgi:hypothetical protein
MIGAYLNQTVLWKRRMGVNRHAEPIFSEPISINVRFEGKRRMVRDAKGQDVVSEALVFCREDVQPGDVLVYEGREWTVITVSPVPDLSGRISHREVAV